MRLTPLSWLEEFEAWAVRAAAVMELRPGLDDFIAHDHAIDDVERIGRAEDGSHSAQAYLVASAGCARIRAYLCAGNPTRESVLEGRRRHPRQLLGADRRDVVGGVSLGHRGCGSGGDRRLELQDVASERDVRGGLFRRHRNLATLVTSQCAGRGFASAPSGTVRA